MTLGPDGVPREVRRRAALDTHRLIEEFMIAANRAIGTWAAERETPFLFRVHAEPDADAIARFLGDALALMPGTSPAALSDLVRLRHWLEALPDSPLGRTVQRLFLRALRKAIYAPIDIGHFGLGLRGYCHFTSPIRRYPDLFVHRRVKELIDGRASTASWETAQLEAQRSSRAEVNAQEAEREMVRLKIARFMERRLGAEFAGHITGMIPAGLFAELDAMPVEGFIPREALPAGFRLSDARPAFLHERSREEFRPGDPVRILVARVDLRARRVEFALVREEGPRGRGRRDRADRNAGAGVPEGAGSEGPRRRPKAGSRTASAGRGRSRSARAQEGRLAGGRPKASGRPGGGTGGRTGRRPSAPKRGGGPKRGGPGKRGGKKR
jgi:ribonuclease R